MWAQMDSNHRPFDYESAGLSTFRLISVGFWLLPAIFPTWWKGFIMFLTKTKKSPYYQLVYEVDGKRTTISTKTKLKLEARKYLQNFQPRKRESKKATSISLEQFSIEYINYCKSCRSNSYIKCSILTAFKKFIPFIGNISLNKITSRQIEVKNENGFYHSR